MQLQVLGSGDAFGSGGRLRTCIHVNSERSNFLLDCGASAMIAMRRFAVQPNTSRNVLIAHLHGDHFAGLPFFILDAQLYGKRRQPITLAGPPGLRKRLEQTMEALFPALLNVGRRFDMEVIELPRAVRSEVNGLTVTPLQVGGGPGPSSGRYA